MHLAVVVSDLQDGQPIALGRAGSLPVLAVGAVAPRGARLDR